jgi:hypothetical protein
MIFQYEDHFERLNQPFELSNSRYRREARETLCFAKHHNLSLYITTRYFKKNG